MQLQPVKLLSFNCEVGETKSTCCGKDKGPLKHVHVQTASVLSFVEVSDLPETFENNQLAPKISMNRTILKQCFVNVY